jgi:hypothetical protein
LTQSLQTEAAGIPVGMLPPEWLAEPWQEWESRLLPALQQLVQRVIRRVLEALDDRLALVRDGCWHVEAYRRHQLVTPWGVVTIRRRLYRRGRERLFLLDRLLGWRPGRSYTPKVAQLAALVASQLPFRPASELLEALGISLSHMTVHRLVQQLGSAIAEQQEQQAEALFTDGELPPSEERQVERLYVEADGVWIHLQREQQDRVEVWSSITYEGWQAIVPRRPRSPDPPVRYRLVEKRVFSDLASTGTVFWQRHITALHHRYDLRTVRRWVLNGDGARWIDLGQGYLPGCVRQLDRFHLARALRRGLGPLASEAYGLCVSGNWAKTARLWQRALKAATSDQQRRLIREQRAYLKGQADALQDYRRQVQAGPECRSLGAMESNGDKLIKNRMAKRGMAWTLAGAKHMAKVLQERKNGQLDRWLAVQTPAPPILAEALRQQPPSAATVLTELDTDDSQWLAMSLPILRGAGPHGPLYHILKDACHG